MNLQQLRYFKALVEEGSFVAAAARCTVAQPTLSNGIAQLEAEIGNRLFQRTTRSVRLTPFGEQLLPSILETLASFDKLKDLTRRIDLDAQQSVQVGISPVVGIHRAEAMFGRFKKICPEAKLIYHENNLADLSDLLRRGEIDLILAPFCTSLPIDGDCVALLLESDPLMFIPKRDDAKRWAARQSVELKEIASEVFVLVPEACGLTQVTKRLFDSHQLTLRRYLGEASSYAVVEDWTELGLGAGILPRSKIRNSSREALPILRNGEPVALDYFAFGKPNTISPELFSDVWNCFLESNIMGGLDAAARKLSTIAH